jgi:Amiloride-sensitive sodium channel
MPVTCNINVNSPTYRSLHCIDYMVVLSCDLALSSKTERGLRKIHYNVNGYINGTEVGVSSYNKQVLIHDQNEVPLMRELGFKVSPAFCTVMAIELRKVRLETREYNFYNIIVWNNFIRTAIFGLLRSSTKNCIGMC